MKILRLITVGSRYFRKCRRFFFMTVVLGVVGLVTLALPAQEKVHVRLKTLLVSIENYDIGSLHYANNDIKELSNQLMVRYGSQAQAIIDYPSDFDDRSKEPDRYQKAIQNAIVEWADQLETDDIAILYLAGHGIADSSQKLYLPLKNFDGNNFDVAAIPIEWIRSTLENTPAQNKLILLDTCFSGKTESDSFTMANAEEIAQTFEIPNVTTLASSRADQKSWIWPQVKHSLFTFWVIEAFKGNADLNGNQQISIDELYEYLDEQVSWISQKEADSDPKQMEPQNPILINRDAIAKSFSLPLKAGKTSEVIDNIASNLDLFLGQTESETLIVPDFITGNDGNFDKAYGSLSRSMAVDLNKSFAKISSKRHGGSYRVLAENATRQLLSENGITPSDLATSRTKELEYDGEKIHFIVSGQIRYLGEMGLLIEADLYDAQSQRKLGSARGTALMSENELALAGCSFVRRDKDTVHTPASTSSAQNTDTDAEYTMVPDLGLVEDQELKRIESVNEETDQSHPILDSSLPYDVQIWTHPAESGRDDDYRPRQGKVIDNVWYIPLEKGEEYAIFLKNSLPETVFVRVLVDGLNTISQRMPVVQGAKFAIVSGLPSSQEESSSGNGDSTDTDTAGRDGEAPSDSPIDRENGDSERNDGRQDGNGDGRSDQESEREETVFAPRVALDQARPWVIPGTRENGGKPKMAMIRGFYDENWEVAGEDSLYRFQYVDADESLAACQKYTEQIGLITVAFYSSQSSKRYVTRGATRGGTRGGTGIGEAEATMIRHYSGEDTPEAVPAAVYSIRYVSREAFDELISEHQPEGE